MTEMQGENKNVSLLQLPIPLLSESSDLRKENFLRVKPKDDLEILQENRNSRLFSGPYEVISMSDEELANQDKHIAECLRKKYLMKSCVIFGIVIFNAILGSLIFFYIFPSNHPPLSEVITTENSLNQLISENSTPIIFLNTLEESINSNLKVERLVTNDDQGRFLP